MVGSYHSGLAHAKPWSKSELVIAVYFSSRSICSKALSELLSCRGYHRTERAIERKIRYIVNSTPLLRPDGQWDVDIVDRWIDDTVGHDAVNRLTTFTSEDATAVAVVGISPNIVPQFDVYDASNFMLAPVDF